MNLRKGLTVLPLAAILFSCGAKTISYDEAIKFINENYTATEEKAIKKMTEEFIGHPENNDASKAAVKAIAAELGFTLDDKFYGKIENASSGASVTPITEALFKKQFPKEINPTITLNGKELSVTAPLQDMGEGYKLGLGTVFDSNGYAYKISTTTAYDANGLKYSFDTIATATEFK